jgi:hypothetical protein
MSFMGILALFCLGSCALAGTYLYLRIKRMEVEDVR